MSSLQNFGKTIKELRERHAMTQQELASAIGVTNTYISKIENGKIDKLPSDRVFYALAETLSVYSRHLMDIAGKIDIDELREIAENRPEALRLFRAIKNFTEMDWKKIQMIIGE